MPAAWACSRATRRARARSSSCPWCSSPWSAGPATSARRSTPEAHPRDDSGKEAIARLHELLRALPAGLRAAFLPNHDLELAKTLVAGADVWLNTPLPPLEASGTSGMKAALNGVLNLGVLDGWWVEACEDGVNGWAIGIDGDGPQDHAAALYEKLEASVLPLYHGDRAGWRRMMKEAIRSIASYFNSQRMMRRYASEVYLR